MRICVVSPFSHDVRITPRLELAIRMARRGHRLIFVAPRGQFALRGTKTPNIAHEKLQGVEMFYFPVRFPVSNLAYPVPDLLEETRLIHRIVSRGGVDVVHFYQPEFLTSIPLLFVKRALHKPTMLTINGFPGTSWHYGDMVVDLAGLAYTQTLTRILLQDADKVLLYATRLQKYARELGVPDSKMILLPEGVDNDFPKDAKDVRKTVRKGLGVSDDEKLIIFTGRLVPVKGVPILIEAFKRLYDSHPTVRLLVVGDGPYRGSYEALSGDLLGKAVRFTGLVTSQTVKRFLLASDIFVLPSLSEGISSSLLEASLSGLPCVVSDTGAASDIIENGKSGLIVGVNDVGALLRALSLLLEDEKMALDMGKKARSRVGREFTWDRIVKRYEWICERLVRK